MSNDYMDSGDYSELARLTLAKAEDINTFMSTIVAGFDRLPGELPLKQDRVGFIAADSGAINAHIITPTNLPAAYVDGMKYTFRAATTNTGAATVDTYGTGSVLLGVKAIRSYAGVALAGGEIIENAFVTIAYDGTNGYWRIVNQAVAIASVSITNFDIDILPADTAPADADTVAKHDAVDGVKNKVTLANLLVAGWSAITTLASTDTITGLQASSGLIKKFTLASLVSFIFSQEEVLARDGKITATLSSSTTAMTANRRYRISGTATGTLPTFTAGQWCIVEFTVGSGVTGTVGRNSQTIDGVAGDDTYTGTGGTTGPVWRYYCDSAGVVVTKLIESVSL